MKLYSLVFFIPVFLIATAAPQASTPQMLPNQNIGFNTMGTADMSPSPTPEPVATPSPSVSVPSADSMDTPIPAETPTPEGTPIPEMDVDEMSVCALDQSAIMGQGSGPFAEYLYSSLDDLLGQEITLYGFVYKDDSFPAGTILVSRLMITCCAADAMVMGYHVRVADTDDFSNDEWIQVTGTVQRFSMEMYGDMHNLPILTGGTVTRCEAPPYDEAYVYP